jgi:hypothetical protein
MRFNSPAYTYRTAIQYIVEVVVAVAVVVAAAVVEVVVAAVVSVVVAVVAAWHHLLYASSQAGSRDVSLRRTSREVHSP